MDDASLLIRVLDGLRGFFLAQAGACDRAELIQRDGLVALVNSHIPERSLWNSVLYEDAGALEEAVPELADAYARSGVRAWTVWVHPGDEDTARALERDGHVFDAEPMAMGVEIDEVLQGVPEEDRPFWIREGGIEAVGPLNEQAYGYAEGEFSSGFDRHPEHMHVYLAGAAGPPQSCAIGHDMGDNCDITLVATLPEARGRGMAGALMRRALADARERGCSTTTLVATRLGYPVYARMGYRDLGRLQMWERRKRDGG
jgi:GNAT superfamily N-acetyltransferase